jgi:ferrous iron transport protein A
MTVVATDRCLLTECPIGSKAVVVRVDAEAAQRRRLLDLGLVEGARVSVEGRSPLGDPTSYEILGAVIALRREQSDCVIVKLL